jgi:uncharacterized Zn finger protein
MKMGYWGSFPRYVSKAEKQRKAAKAVAALTKKGHKLEPVAAAGREIARTWWGKAWTQNLERYADYENRVPRGRTYVRSGAVLDLKISANTITALVAGSRPQPYKITIHIASLDKKVEKSLKAKSQTSLDSMQALLSGQFPTELKEEFFKQGGGLFPAPREIRLACSCPDWAEMCKHVAAALYGTAVRLDEKPELFFTLRGIRVEEFVGEMVKTESVKILKKAKRASSRVIASKDAEVAALFGITMDEADKGGKKRTRTPVAAKATTERRAAAKRTSGKTAGTRTAKRGTASKKPAAKAAAVKRKQTR